METRTHSIASPEQKMCPLCQSERTTFYCEKEGYKIFKCLSCQNGFLDLSSFSIDLIDFYQNNYHKTVGHDEVKGYDDYYAMESSLTRTFRKHVQDLLQIRSRNKINEYLLDVGCGPGFFLKVASRYYRARGVEIGKEAVFHARNVLGLDVIQGEFKGSLYSPQSFDVVTMFDVVEHLKNPISTMKDVYALLKPGGVFMLTTGDFSSLAARFFGKRWHLMTLPDHLFFFSKEGLMKILEQIGFQIISVTYPMSYFSIDYLVERVMKSFLGVTSYRNQVVLRKFLRKWIVPVNLWDIMQVVVIR